MYTQHLDEIFQKYELLINDLADSLEEMLDAFDENDAKHKNERLARLEAQYVLGEVVKAMTA